MMTFFKTRRGAVCVLVLVVIFATVLGVNRSLASLSSDIEDMFYNGVDGETPIETYIENRINASKMIVLIADNYPELKPLRDELYDAYNNLYEADGIGAKYSANERLQAAFEALYEALIETDTLSTRHYEDASSYADTINNTLDKIRRSSYNDKVDEYETVVSSLPVSLFRLVIFADAPERFA